MNSVKNLKIGIDSQRVATPKLRVQKYNTNNGNNKLNRYNQTNKIKRYPYHLICGRRFRRTSESAFEDFVRNVLIEEEVNPEDYILSTYNLSVFIDFAHEEDMERVLHNHKYEEYDGAQISFNKKYKRTDDKILYFIGLPKDITRKELDNILTYTYNLCVHEVTKIIPSYEDENLMFANVSFEYEEDAIVCFDTVKEIKGYPIQILLSNNNDITSSSSATSDIVQQC